MLPAAGPPFSAKDIGDELKAQIPENHEIIRWIA